jgi:hypothetical protein
VPPGQCASRPVCLQASVPPGQCASRPVCLQASVPSHPVSPLIHSNRSHTLPRPPQLHQDQPVTVAHRRTHSRTRRGLGIRQARLHFAIGRCLLLHVPTRLVALFISSWVGGWLFLLSHLFFLRYGLCLYSSFSASMTMGLAMRRLPTTSPIRLGHLTILEGALLLSASMTMGLAR